MTTLLLVLLVAIGFIASTCLSLAESSFFSLGAIRLRRLRESHSHLAARGDYYLSRPRQLLITLVIGNTVALSVVSAAATALGLQWHPAYGPAVAAAVTTMGIFFFAEVIPKTLGVAFPEKGVLVTAVPVTLAEKIMYPAVRATAALTDFLTGGIPNRNLDLGPEDIAGLIKESELEGVLQDDEAAIIERIVGLGGKTVGEIATPRVRVSALPADIGLSRAVPLLLAMPHSRVLVYEDELENVVGVLHVKDVLLAAEETGRVGDVARPAEFVLNTTPVLAVLTDFLADRNQIAAVVDEYGALDGVVTMADILREITGDLAARITPLADGRYEVAGDVRLEEINDALDLTLADEDAETIAGYLINRIGRIPAAGESWEEEAARFVVLDAEPQRVNAVIVEKRER